MNGNQAYILAKTNDKSILAGGTWSADNVNHAAVFTPNDGGAPISIPVPVINGEDGVSITDLSTTGDHLMVRLSNGSIVDAGVLPRGEKGEKGDTGNDGQKGDTGVSIIGIAKTATVGLVDTYTITFSDGTVSAYDVINGANITKTSQLTNDSDFVSKTTINLVNYFLKDETYSKAQVDELLRNVGAGLGFEIVSTLPTENISAQTIYLIRVTGTNTYTQYLRVGDEWANLGSTTLDLSNFYNKQQIDAKLLDYVTGSNLLNHLASYAQRSELAKVATTNSYNDLDDLPEIPDVTAYLQAAAAEATYLKIADAETALEEKADKGTSLSDYGIADAYTKAETEAEINSRIGSVYKPAGSVLFAALPIPDEAHLGFVYNLLDGFTTTADFVEGAGNEYPAGTDVAIVQADTDYKYNVMSGFVDLSNYAEKATTLAGYGITDGVSKSDIQNTYNATSQNPISGVGVRNALTAFPYRFIDRIQVGLQNTGVITTTIPVKQNVGAVWLVVTRGYIGYNDSSGCGIGYLIMNTQNRDGTAGSYSMTWLKQPNSTYLALGDNGSTFTITTKSITNGEAYFYKLA